MPTRIYADNAATSFPKPPEVLAAMTDYARHLGASAGRGAYREAVQTGQRVADCRRGLAKMLNAEDPDRIVFTLNCSEALNLAMRGLLNPGDHVVSSRFEHNSVLRPLHDLMHTRGIEATFVPADRMTGRVDPAAIRDAVRPNTRLIVLQHGSNVTGVIQPISDVAEIARHKRVTLLVDAAQSAGHLPIDVRALGIDLLAFPGHKGLLGPLGTGGLYIRSGLENELRPLISGGTGSQSDLPTQPDSMPDKYESGSHNAIGLIGLGAAVNWLLQRGVDSIQRHEQALSARFLDGIAPIDGITVYGPPRAEHRTAVFSIRLTGLDPADLAAVLDSDFNIQTRSGLYCAPWAHETLGTHADGGATRISFGPFTTQTDVDVCTTALAAIAAPAAARESS